MESIKNTNRYFGKQLSGIIFVVFGLSFLSQPSLALPPEIRTDILLITAQKYSEKKNYKKALENLEKIFALEVDPPESAYYHYGKALGNAGRHNDGIEQIKEYLSKFGKHGKYYDPALQVLAEITDRVRAVDAGTAVGLDYDTAMGELERRFAS
uniref:Uncharacterized protein n=1 Tax=Candidatus Kentrum sp. TUN TaxID=2126343 RepID=A0A451AIF6_9GAMM|nr:MAG: hypothetical protein BECKTUN1418F_GA0071002_11224 [Candidatus Kentron sp. TUN]VFK65828.1 MAG: hypothetical protein BECKTUN1418E_GA0071001_11143 [Candidatus Kentron sp. TUN]